MTSELRILTDDPSDVSALQSLLERAPVYHVRVTGSPATPTAAEELLHDLPPDGDPADKFVYGVYVNGALVGCVDVARGYPGPDFAFIGLLLIDESLRGLGIGRSACGLIEREALSWGVSTLRLAVLETNAEVVPFWEKMGFALTGERLTYVSGSVESHVLLMDKHIES
ncbi:MAG: GNAT family N-acetyltransferase [Candidatus Eisenbacteria bacterium]|nr:GNAT family N-acetyltransferase [Candidatus Eisenbacteria bacterium]